MARFEVTSPTKGFTGRVAGVAFADGKAIVDSSSQRAALAYFDRKPYRVVRVDEPDADLAQAEPAAPIKPDDAPKMPAKSATKADWKAYAISQGMSEEDAEKATRDALAEQFAAKEGAGQ